MPLIVRTCSEPGCSTLGMGVYCLAHEPMSVKVFVRGRPWPPRMRLEPTAVKPASSLRTLEGVAPAA